MTLSEKIVYELITKNVLDINAIKALSINTSNVYRQLGKLLSAGYIREKSYTIKSGRKTKTVDYYCLTSSGFRFLAPRMLTTVPWLRLFHDDTQNVRIIGSSIRPSKIAHRYVKVSTAALMADMAGANESTLFVSLVMGEDEQTEENESSAANALTTETLPLTEDDVPLDVIDFYSGLLIDLRDEYLPHQDNWNEDVHQPKSRKGDKSSEKEPELYTDEEDVESTAPTLAEIVTEDMSIYYTAGKHYDSEIRFVDAQTVKWKIEETARKKMLTPPDLRGGRYSGLIGSPCRVAMMYCASEILPVKWKRNFKKREMTAYSSGRQLFFPGYAKDIDPNAVLLVSDAKAFDASYDRTTSTKTAGRYRNSETLRYGDGFSKFFIVPISYIGAAELNSIMTSTCEAVPADEVAKLTVQEQYERNTGPLAGTFPLIDKTREALVTVIQHLDIIWLEHINATMNRFPENKYIILCREWHVPYMKVVITHDCMISPNIDFSTGSKNTGAELLLAVEKEAEFMKSAEANDL